MGNGGGLGIVLSAKQLLSACEIKQKILLVWVINWLSPSHPYPAHCFHPLISPKGYGLPAPHKLYTDPERSQSRIRIWKLQQIQRPKPFSLSTSRPPGAFTAGICAKKSYLLVNWKLTDLLLNFKPKLTGKPKINSKTWKKGVECESRAQK